MVEEAGAAVIVASPSLPRYTLHNKQSLWKEKKFTPARSTS
jgi:hypothetical protein